LNEKTVDSVFGELALEEAKGNSRDRLRNE